MTLSRYEEKLKRTYFHVKPLDQKQLRVWDQYLDWQGSQQDHQRTVVLFERCLIPCALYEQFWAKYARYLERAHKEGRDRVEDSGLLNTYFYCITETRPGRVRLRVTGH